MTRAAPKRFSRSIAGALAAAAASLAVAAAGGAARAADAPGKSACKMYMSPEGALAVTPGTDRPVVTVEINGHPVRALIDTGAASTMVGEDAARRLGLVLLPAPGFGVMGGVGGAFQPHLVDLHLRLGGPDTSLRLLAGGRTGDVDMLIGDDLLHNFDVEMDLAHGVIRLLKAQHCADADMPYWAQQYAEAAMIPMGSDDDHVVVAVKLNGRASRAYLDSGASNSVATLALARRAGVTLSAAHEHGQGLGDRDVAESFALVDSFQMGDERIGHTRLTFADLFGRATYADTGSIVPQRIFTDVEMLLGADFLRSHRVMISPSHHKVFFTYNGGPVFAPATVTTVAAPAPAATTPPPAAPHTGA